MFAVKIETHYYQGTYNTDRSRYLAVCAARTEAERIAETLRPQGVYRLAYGEYSAPDITVKTVSTDKADRLRAAWNGADMDDDTAINLMYAEPYVD